MKTIEIIIELIAMIQVQRHEQFVLAHIAVQGI